MRLFLDVGSEEEVRMPGPLRFPDLIPLDIFAWGFIKDVVYNRKV
jgi:hypothetical protein